MFEKRRRYKGFEQVGRAAVVAAGVTMGAELGGLEPMIVPPEIIAQENAYERQQTHLTQEEIEKELARCCSFLSKRPPIVSLTLPQNDVNPFQLGGFVEKSLRGIRSSALGNEDDLVVAQISFSSFGGEFRAAMYVPELKTLFLDQTTDRQVSGRKKTINQFAYRELGKQEGRNWYTLAQETDAGATLFNLPAATLNAKKDVIVQEMKNFRFRHELRRIKTESAISHEVFHHFYMHQLGKEGYQGPSMSELLFLAFSESQQRFGKRIQDYFMYLEAPELEHDITRITGEALVDDSEKLRKVCDMLAQRYHLTTYQKGDSDDAHLGNGLLTFLNEYLARVFSGLQGYTPWTMEEKFTEAARSFGPSSDTIPRDLLPWYHEPTDNERAAFARMSWNGAPLVQ